MGEVDTSLIDMIILSYQFVSELFLQRVKLREVPDGGASQGGRVLHQHHLAAQRAEVELQRHLQHLPFASIKLRCPHRGSVQLLGLEVVDRGGHPLARHALRLMLGYCPFRAGNSGKRRTVTASRPRRPCSPSLSRASSESARSLNPRRE